MRGEKVIKIIGWIFLGILGAAAIGVVLGLVVMWLWNWLMPVIFGLPVINYWQAVGIFILCHLLFKGHHPHKDFHDNHARKFRHRVKGCMAKHPDENPGGGTPEEPECHTAS
jgi:hypothetical protein